MQNKLKFHSCLTGGKYAADFSLPDFIRNEDGSFSREKTLEFIRREEYGIIDEKTVNTTFEDVTDDYNDRVNGYSVCGKAEHKTIRATMERDGKSSSFDFDVFIPVKVEKPFFAVQIDFGEKLPTKYSPIEELLDAGLGVAHIYYDGVTEDNADTASGAAALFHDENDPYSPGKIEIWAYAMRLAAKYIVDNGITEKEKLYAAGHSRLGKAAILACAEDEIFAGCFVNNSGCCGVSVSRGKGGETIRDITGVVGYWFNDNFKKYAGKEFEMPFDQHFLIAACAPRKVFVCAADLDTWSDTEAQYLACEAGSAAYEEFGLVGLTRRNEPLPYGDKNDTGGIKFFIRKGPHYFSREDWKFYIDCLSK